MNIKRVFCPVDFSDTSRKALRYAGAIATWYEAVLDVVHVVPDPGGTRKAVSAAVAADTAAQMRAAADAALQKFVDDADLSARLAGLHVLSGTPSAEILEYARCHKPDLLVIGTQGRSGLSHLMIGSNAERVVAHASCPVMTIPPHAREVRSPALAQFKRIVAACDFSAASNHALTYGISLAQENDASLTLLHVIETLAGEDALATADQRTIEYIDQRKRDARKALRALAARDTSAACETLERVALGVPARTILRIAAELHADLLVMGAQGHGPLGVMLFGSTTQTALRRADCPVLTARAPAAIGD
jgi:nucleotide-binding universal stress UspA family protein